MASETERKKVEKIFLMGVVDKSHRRYQHLGYDQIHTQRSVDEANPSTRIEQQWQAKANKSIGIVHFQSKTR